MRHGGHSMTDLEIEQTTEDQNELWSMRDDEDETVRCKVAERLEDQDRLWETRDWTVRTQLWTTGAQAP